MDEECQKTKEGERMKTKSQEVVERAEEERVLKKPQTWWLTGETADVDSAHKHGPQEHVWGETLSVTKGEGGVDNASTHESHLAPGPEVLCG